jgi:hypothetical protein
MRIVGVLDADGPFARQAILHLSGNLLVGQVGQKGKAALGDTHVCVLLDRAYMETDAVGTKSDVSVDV